MASKHTLKKLRGCLVYDFKQPFLVFKQHFTHFNTLFHPHVFPQMFSNNNFQFLNTYTKRTLKSLGETRRIFFLSVFFSKFTVTNPTRCNPIGYYFHMAISLWAVTVAFPCVGNSESVKPAENSSASMHRCTLTNPTPLFFFFFKIFLTF